MQPTFSALTKIPVDILMKGIDYSYVMDAAVRSCATELVLERFDNTLYF